MKVAVIGSRTLAVSDLQNYLPPQTAEIVSGGAKGIDTCARAYAQSTGLPLTEFLPDYSRYKRGAPLRRNLQIVQYADFVLVFWDGTSRGTAFVINECIRQNKPLVVYRDGKIILQQK